MNRGLWQTPVKKVASISIIGIGLLFLISNAKQWWQFRQLKAEKLQLQQQIETSKQKNRKLEQMISYAKTNQFIKNEARKLGWGDNNETVIFLPPMPSPSQAENKTINSPTSPWQSWQRLFFPSP